MHSLDLNASVAFETPGNQGTSQKAMPLIALMFFFLSKKKITEIILQKVKDFK